MKKIILHIDMNSYFASVEQQANPHLRGKPVAVCAYLSPRGCILASSMEAKKLGIKTGMRVCDARALSRNIVILENDPAKYRSVTEKIFSIFSEYTDRMEPYSIDEAFLDLTGWVKDFDGARKLGEAIRQRITHEVGEWLKCSIGISWTRWLAKFASDIAEKNSIFILSADVLDKAYQKHSLTDAWGIGSRTVLRLNQLGIRTLCDLKNYPPGNLLSVFGKHGYYLWANVNGMEIEGVKTSGQTQAKSIGHSYCVPNKTMDLRYLRPVLMKLCEKTGQRLRRRLMEARTLSAGLSYVQGGGRYKNIKIAEHLFDTPSIFRRANSMLFSEPLEDQVRMLAVSASSLAPMSGQLSFFQDTLKQKKISLALDDINNTFGEFTIFPGEMFGTASFAHDRIGFRKIEI